MRTLFRRSSLIVLLSSFAWMGSATAQIAVHHINVGQADATLLEFKSAAILVDAGAEIDSSYRDRLLKYLDTFFNRRADLKRTIYSLIITHPHIDHTRYLMNVMTRYNVLNLVDNGDNKGTGIEPVRAARQFAAKRKIVYNSVADKQVTANGYSTSWLQALKTSPSMVDVRLLSGFAGCADENNDSVVVLVIYKEARILISGDAEWEDKKCTPAITRMLKRFGGSGKLDIDVYKVGHHGSKNGTNVEFLKAMTPEIAVLSSGHHSYRDPQGEGFDAYHYGHPREEAVQHLEGAIKRSRPPVNVYTMNGIKDIRENRKIDKAIYCTCWDGNIVISTDESGKMLNVSTEKP